jgi:hypothetical protein
MSSPPRRSGFRLPWASQDEADKTNGSGPAAAEAGEEPTSEQQAAAPAVSEAARDEPEAVPKPEAATKSKTAAKPRAAPEAEKEAEPAGSTADATAEGPAEGAQAERATKEPPAEPSEPEPQQEFLRDLVTAMRGVADQAREEDLRDLRPRVDDRIARLRTEAEEQAAALSQQADTDVSGIGDWARTETERIKAEAEARVAARRKELEEQLAAAERHANDGTEEVRRRVAEYERSLDAFFTQLGDLSDPALFAAAAKEMPRPPEIDALEATAQATNGNRGGERAPANAETAAPPATAATDEAAPADSKPSSPTTVTAASTVVVKGLTSFGSITAFKQSLEAVDGVNSVTLSLGPTGEFVYRALHSEGFDLQGAIAAMERGAAAVERQPDGTLQVKMGRGR